MAELTPRGVALLACELALGKKGEDVQLLDLLELTDIADYFVIASGTSDVQVKAIADAIVEGLKRRGIVPLHIEGYGSLKWVLLDYITVVVHVFYHETRGYYDLESFWGDASRETFE